MLGNADTKQPQIFLSAGRSLKVLKYRFNLGPSKQPKEGGYSISINEKTLSCFILVNKVCGCVPTFLEAVA